MNKEQFVKGMSYLGTIYSKEFTQQEVEIYFDFLKSFNYDIFISAIKSLALQSKYLPRISEIVDECNKQKFHRRHIIVEYMKEKGFFKTHLEYEKTLRFIQLSEMSGWLADALSDYYKMMLAEKGENAIGTSNAYILKLE